MFSYAYLKLYKEYIELYICFFDLKCLYNIIRDSYSYGVAINSGDVKGSQQFDVVLSLHLIIAIAG